MVTTGRTKPGSKPPWNTEVANTLFDAIATIADVRAELAQAVHGRIPDRLPYRQTGRALKEIGNLSHGVDEHLAGEAAWQIDAIITRIRQLPAIDQEERWRKLPEPCPRCERAMLRACVRLGRIACLGCMRRGQIIPGTVSEGVVEWDDGEFT